MLHFEDRRVVCERHLQKRSIHRLPLGLISVFFLLASAASAMHWRIFDKSGASFLAAKSAVGLRVGQAFSLRGTFSPAVKSGLKPPAGPETCLTCPYSSPARSISTLHRSPGSIHL